MTVTVFTNPNNPQCEATEQELSKLGVRYVAVDLTQNPSTFEQIKDAASSKSGRHLTEFLTGVGHRPDLIRQLRSIAARRGNSSQASRQPEGTNPKRQ